MMIKNFRYTSPWEKFENAVKTLKNLLDQNQAHWMVGFMRGFDLEIDDAAINSIQEDTIKIIRDEIMYLLILGLEGEELSEEQLRTAISNEKLEIADDEIKTVITSVKNKFELVKDAFAIDKLIMRYNLKNESVCMKLSDFKYNILTQTMSNGDRANCALINVAGKKDLVNFRTKGMDVSLAGKEQEKNISFLCDEEDIDILIHLLEKIKSKIKEC